jgi:hypothetical protein
MVARAAVILVRREGPERSASSANQRAISTSEAGCNLHGRLWTVMVLQSSFDMEKGREKRRCGVLSMARKDDLLTSHSGRSIVSMPHKVA